jgi:hypothetical protein
MAEADRANSTSLSALSRPATSASQSNPSIDRAALRRRAHQIARQARPHMGNYREALVCGLKAAWGLVAVPARRRVPVHDRPGRPRRAKPIASDKPTS